MKVLEGPSVAADGTTGVGGVGGSLETLLLRNGRNILLLLCGEVSWRWVVGFVTRVEVGVGLSIGVRSSMGVGLVAIVADVGIVARHVFVDSRLSGFDSLYWSLQKAEIAGEVDHGSIRVGGIFECGGRDCGLLFALAAARGF